MLDYSRGIASKGNFGGQIDEDTLNIFGGKITKMARNENMPGSVSVVIRFAARNGHTCLSPKYCCGQLRIGLGFLLSTFLIASQSVSGYAACFVALAIRLASELDLSGI